MFDDEENSLPCKVILLGEAGTDKTGIINCFINKTFDENQNLTNRASFSTKTLKFYSNGDKNIIFEIRDTAGQEIYRSLTKIFLSNINVAILVYDITKRETFEQIKNYWYPLVKNVTPENTSKKYLLNLY